MTENRNSRTVRTRYLLGGRRVKVSDLVNGELLPVGSTLVFKQPRSGVLHSAEVTAGGAILLADGRGV
jgi:hypothetical protein